MDKNNKDTEKKNETNNEQEPWEQPIYDDNGDESSRTNRRGNGEGRNWYMITLITLLFLVVIVTTFAILYWNVSAKMNPKKPAESTIALQSSSSTVEETSTSISETSTNTEASTSSTASSTMPTSTVTSVPQQTTASTFADVEKPVDQGDAQVNNNVQDQQRPATGNDAIVGQGGNVNLYRIAKNNGLTVDELLQMNPGVDPQNLQNGQAIRVK
ncbi:LysM peptidoglycan-binding domain-containing protein [Vagococcus vulneris]|uniref:LysM peptidoglycan-binding domain-containing protein n=1 Tax=Vagococcus vulneris TaxID=1977869 RepID=UPI001402CBA3|nr:LysM domain-containing protein [Vagococcus vulneris]